MINDATYEDHDVSIYDIGATMLRSRWRIVRWMVGVAVLFVLPVLRKPAVYRASASVVSQGSGVSGAQSLAALVGQRGLVGSSNESPEFYVMLLRSKELLVPIAHDTFSVSEERNRRVAFKDLFEIEGTSPLVSDERAYAALQGMTTAAADRMTGVVSVSARTPWPSVSKAIASEMVDRLNAFNQRTRQSQAAAERKFVEGRLALATQELRLAENRLEAFLTSNKQYQNSPQLSFAQDRLRRDVAIKQNIFSTLTDSYEEVRIREVRDIPVITVVESPRLPAAPEPRGRLTRAVLGAVVGGVIAVLLVLVSEMLKRGRATEDAKAAEFFRIAFEIRRSLVGWIPGARGRAPS